MNAHHMAYRHMKRKMHKHTAKYKNENATEKAARVTASATKWMAFFTFLLFLVTGGTVIILKNQLHEMHEGGTQTDKIIAAANLIEDHQKQIVADNRQVLADNRNALANSLTENRREMDLALQQNRQALEANERESKLVLDASIEAARIDQRAWISAGGNTISIAGDGQATLEFLLVNTGRTPGLDAETAMGWEVRNMGTPTGPPDHPNYRFSPQGAVAPQLRASAQYHREFCA